MSVKYLIPFLFLWINVFSQDKIELQEQCRSKYDSIFKNYFGNKFFERNIHYNKSKSSIDVLTNDPNNEQFDRIFLNMKNYTEIKKYIDKYPNFDYLEYYNYTFHYRKKVFYEQTYTCQTINNLELSNLINKEILEYYNKIKNREYLSPKKAIKIAKANGLKNICYQSLTSASFHNKNQDVWQIQDCSNEKKAKVIELNPKSGKVLTLFERGYEKGDKAAYWGLFNKNK